MPKRRTDKSLAGAALLFAALGDATRLTLLRQLSDGGPASISMLAEEFSMTRQGVTKHLQVLASAGIIDGSRQGREPTASGTSRRSPPGGTRRSPGSNCLRKNEPVNV